MKRAKPFATEAEMCARFIAAIGPEWISYNETAGYDLLLVRKADGFQIGVEAKLKLNAHVISQALEEYGAFYAAHAGPDCRAVLVPEEEASGFGLICKYIGLTIIYVRSEQQPTETKYYRQKIPVFEPALPGGPHGSNEQDWHEWAPPQRHKLPDYVPDVVAGSPSPVQLTHWKICAIKICIILERRGYLLRSDFAHIKIDHRRWLPSGQGWLKLDAGRYLKGAYFPNFKAQHPRVYDEISADYEKWKPADPLGPLLLPPAHQESML